MTRTGKSFRTNVAAQLLRAVGQAAYFILVARVLGAADFGIFASVVALTALVSPFTSVGVTNLMIRNVSLSSELAQSQLALASRVIAVGGFMVSAGVAIVGPLLLTGSASTVDYALIATSDLVFLKLSENAGFLFQVLGDPIHVLRCSTTAAFSRLGITSAAVSLGASSIHAVCFCYALGGVIAAVYAWVASRQAVGHGTPDWQRFRSEIRLGFLFSIGMSSQNVYNDLDKTLVNAISGAASAGVYSAAYRVVDIGFLPARAILNASYPEFFRAGEQGDVRQAFSFAKRRMRLLCGYGLPAAIVIAALAPILPRFLGQDFERSVSLIRILAALIFIRCIHYVLADCLTGLARQGARTMVQVAIALVNAAGCLFLISLYGVRGAALASLITDALLAVALWLVILRLLRAKSL